MPKGDVPVTFMVSTSVEGFWFLRVCVSLTFYWGVVFNGKVSIGGGVSPKNDAMLEPCEACQNP